MIEKFINDCINLTQGQLFIKYWMLWLSISIVILISFLIYIKQKKNSKWKKGMQ